MLRRYLFSLFPTLLFSAVLGIALLSSSEKNLPGARTRGKHLALSLLCFFGLVIVSLPAWARSISYSENPTLLAQIEDFSRSFGERDLILVDQFTTGNGFTMLTGPAQYLFGKNAVYFFNPTDLDRLDLTGYDRIFLVTPTENAGRYQDAFGLRLTHVGNQAFTLDEFGSNQGGLTRFPEKKTLVTESRIYEISK